MTSVSAMGVSMCLPPPPPPPPEARGDERAARKHGGIPAFLRAQLEVTQDADEAQEACLAEYAADVQRAEHKVSERWMPRTGEVMHAMSKASRAELIRWLIQSFAILQLDDALVHSVVLTFDRYFAKHPHSVEDQFLPHMILTVVCTELKTAGRDDFLQFGWKNVLCQLCQGRIPLVLILRMEVEVLAGLDYVVGLPTPITFLDTLYVRHRANPDAPLWRGFAVALLELALLDPETAYSRPHAHLAAGALAAALRVFGAPAAAREELLEDSEAYLPGKAPLSGSCEEELLSIWLDSLEGSAGESSNACKVIHAKFYARFTYAAKLPTSADLLDLVREAHAGASDSDQVCSAGLKKGMACPEHAAASLAGA